MASTLGIKEAQDILGLKPGADLAAVKQAVRKLCQKFHPDKEGGDPEMFRRAREAGEVLEEVLVDHDIIPDEEYLDALNYVITMIGQRYVAAEMAGQNEKRRRALQMDMDVFSFASLVQAASDLSRPPSAESFVLNALEQEILANIDEFRTSIDRHSVQGAGLRMLARNMKAPKLAYSVWQDARDSLAQAIRQQRNNIRMAKLRLKAMEEFEAIQLKRKQEAIRLAHGVRS
ncbi:hypothetical protein Peetri_00199 [Pseudomonas phage vB_PpuM-Peetri]